MTEPCAQSSLPAATCRSRSAINLHGGQQLGPTSWRHYPGEQVTLNKTGACVVVCGGCGGGCCGCGGCGGCGADVMYDTCLCRYKPTHATNSGGRTPGSKLPASPPPLLRPDGGGTPWPCACAQGPKKSSHQSTKSTCGAAPPALRPLPFNLNWK